MSDKLLQSIIGKAKKAIDNETFYSNERDKIAALNRKVKMDRSDCKEILKILKEL